VCVQMTLYVTEVYRGEQCIQHEHNYFKYCHVGTVFASKIKCLIMYVYPWSHYCSHWNFLVICVWPFCHNIRYVNSHQGCFLCLISVIQCPETQVWHQVAFSLDLETVILKEMFTQPYFRFRYLLAIVVTGTLQTFIY